MISIHLRSSARHTVRVKKNIQRRMFLLYILRFQYGIYVVMHHECAEIHKYPSLQLIIVTHVCVVCMYCVLESIICLLYPVRYFPWCFDVRDNGYGYHPLFLEKTVPLTITFRRRKSFSSSTLRKSFLKVRIVRLTGANQCPCWYVLLMPILFLHCNLIKTAHYTLGLRFYETIWCDSVKIFTGDEQYPSQDSICCAPCTDTTDRPSTAQTCPSPCISWPSLDTAYYKHT